MNKTDFARKLADVTGIPTSKAIETINAMLCILSNTMKEKETIQFIGFGTFEVKITPERKARNPRTMDEIIIPQRHRVIFRPSKTLLSDVNGNDI